MQSVSLREGVCGGDLVVSVIAERRVDFHVPQNDCLSRKNLISTSRSFPSV